MTIAKLGAALALACAVSLPAMAQEADKINQAYDRGFNSGTSPVTAGEFVTCAVYWHVWSDFAEDEFGAAFMAKLRPQLATDAAKAAVNVWDAAASQVYSTMEDGQAAVQSTVDRTLGRAWSVGEGIAMGEDYGMAEMLGSCDPTLRK